MTIATEIRDLKQDIKKLNEVVEANHKTYVAPYLEARRRAEDKLRELEEQLDTKTLDGDTIKEKYPEKETEKETLETK
jgi:phage-related tail protein